MSGFWGLFVQGVVAFGIPGVLATVAAAVVSRRKTRAEVSLTEAGRAKTEAESDGLLVSGARSIAESAALLLEPLQHQIITLSQRLSETDQMTRAHMRLLEEHAAWDRQVVGRLRANSIDVPDPPPLHPPFPSPGGLS